MRNLLLFFLLGCAPIGLAPQLAEKDVEVKSYITKHGINVHCHIEGPCFPREQVEYAFDAVIDDIVSKDEDYNKKDILRKLDAQDGWHSLNFVEHGYGEIGSCPSEKDPKRRCSGFYCGRASKNGWCWGLTRSVTYEGFSNIIMTVSVNAPKCVAATSLQHEIIHFLTRLTRNKRDKFHENIIHFPDMCEIFESKELKNRCRRDTVERASSLKVCKKYCGDLCKWEEKAKKVKKTEKHLAD